VIRHLFKLIWNRKRANALIITEIFFSFLVIFVVVAISTNLISNYRRPLGYDYHGVWNVRVDTKSSMNDERVDAEAAGNIFRMLHELKTMPQIEAVAATRTPPYAFSTTEGVFNINGKSIYLVMDESTDDYARVMGMHVVRGRWFRPEDDALNFRPVVLDVNAARAMYANADPIGQKFDKDDDVELRVVGVVETYRKEGELSTPVNMVFKRVGEHGAGSTRVPQNLMLRLKPGTTADFEPALLARLQALSPAYTFRVRYVEEMRRTALRSRLSGVAVGFVIAAFLIIMVTLGLSGVLWQNVTARTRELGLRRALGATGPHVHRQILFEVAIVATLALLVGTIVVLQIPLMGVFAWLNPGVYPLALALSLATIYALTLLCGLYPSWLAGRVQPAEALHYE
jgi:putative ABC transport system permease protein